MVAETSHPLDRLHERDGGRCWLCFTDCPIEQATRDHVIPDSMGGAYAWANFALAHAKCNNERADRFPIAQYRTFTVRAQQRAWDRSAGRCERCGIGAGLVLDKAPWAMDLSILCTDCRWGATAYRGLMPQAPEELTAAAADLVPEETWAALLQACAEPEPEPILAEAVPIAHDPVQDLVQPTAPAPRAAPRFTPMDHKRQTAEGRARAAELEAAKAARAAAKAAAKAALQASASPEPVPVTEQPSLLWVKRVWRRVAFWRRHPDEA